MFNVTTTRTLIAALAVLALAGIGGCLTNRTGPAGGGASSVSRAQLFPGMGRHVRRVTTTSGRAQQYFDQGLVWAFAFNHDEAIRSFTEAARLDPTCAMAWWGVALCHGPHINYPMMDAASSLAAWTALEKAMSLRHAGTAVEQALIEALARRYANPAPADRRVLDEAYAAAMRGVHQRFPEDADVAVLFAESLLDLHPWDLWTQDGLAKPHTPEIVAVLEQTLRLDPDHPGALHLYIHTVEASNDPARAIPAADRLRDAVPGAGHLVHMPSHIDVRVGRYVLASAANERAIVADRNYRRKSPTQGFYRIYMAHNHHFLAFSSMMEGRSQAALSAARDMVSGVPLDYARENAALVDPYMSIVLDVQKRFGMWDDILAEPRPAAYLPITTAMWRHARGVARAARGELTEAESEKRELTLAIQNVPKGAMMAINQAHDVLAIGERVLAGEIALRRKDVELAARELRAAVALEDRLRYMEPPEWILPVRHSLGAVLAIADRHEEALRVYQADLAKWPENGWSLFGAADCLTVLGRPDEARRAKARFVQAWSRADVTITASCLCVK